MTGTVADPRILFATALKGLAVGIIAGITILQVLVNPSTQDIELTRKLKRLENSMTFNY
ncbi:MAG: hypothetical protein IPJ53_13090 [Saprospiraceae bacterium]|nr:hypothetical protein [Candidatus Vicinibacter affinis]